MNIKATYTSTTDLTPAAQDALMSCGTNRQGAMCALVTAPEVIAELQDAGYLGKNKGLTKRGTIKRWVISEDRMNAAFN